MLLGNVFMSSTLPGAAGSNGSSSPEVRRPLNFFAPDTRWVIQLVTMFKPFLMDVTILTKLCCESHIVEMCAGVQMHRVGTDGHTPYHMCVSFGGVAAAGLLQAATPQMLHSSSSLSSRRCMQQGLRCC